MPEQYRIVTLVHYEPTRGTVDYIDTARVLGKLFARVRSELAKFSVSVTPAEMEQAELVSAAVKQAMMALAKTKGLALRQPEIIPIVNLLKELRTEYRRWDFKCVSESELSDEWYYNAIAPFKDLYERYVDESSDPEVLIEYMVDILAADMGAQIVKEFANPLKLFRRARFPNDKKGETFTMRVDCDHSWGATGQSYVLVIKPKE